MTATKQDQSATSWGGGLTLIKDGGPFCGTFKRCGLAYDDWKVRAEPITSSAA